MRIWNKSYHLEDKTVLQVESGLLYDRVQKEIESILKKMLQIHLKKASNDSLLGFIGTL